MISGCMATPSQRLFRSIRFERTVVKSGKRTIVVVLPLIDIAPLLDSTPTTGSWPPRSTPPAARSASSASLATACPPLTSPSWIALPASSSPNPRRKGTHRHGPRRRGLAGLVPARRGADIRSAGPQGRHLLRYRRRPGPAAPRRQPLPRRTAGSPPAVLAGSPG